MIRVFSLPEYSQQKVSSLTEIEGDHDNILWIDLQNPTSEEIAEVETTYNIRFPTKQQQEEIESSSRYLEDYRMIRINSTFVNLVPGKAEIEENELSFILTEKRLFSLRYFESKVILETVKKIKQFPFIYSNPSKILITLLESRTDHDADLIENVSKHIADISKSINYSGNIDEDVIRKISEYQDLTMVLREALFDKQRVISALNRNEDLMVDNSQRLRTIIKDIGSLIEHVNFNFTRLEYLQQSILGLINIEQNKVIKIFTVASLIFMPPTLIASIYGMNLRMPETQWEYGYLFAGALMVLAPVVTFTIFKMKKWL